MVEGLLPTSPTPSTYYTNLPYRPWLLFPYESHLEKSYRKKSLQSLSTFSSYVGSHTLHPVYWPHSAVVHCMLLFYPQSPVLHRTPLSSVTEYLWLPACELCTELTPTSGHLGINIAQCLVLSAVSTMGIGQFPISGLTNPPPPPGYGGLLLETRGLDN